MPSRSPLTQASMLQRIEGKFDQLIQSLPISYVPRPEVDSRLGAHEDLLRQLDANQRATAELLAEVRSSLPREYAQRAEHERLVEKVEQLNALVTRVKIEGLEDSRQEERAHRVRTSERTFNIWLVVAPLALGWLVETGLTLLAIFLR